MRNLMMAILLVAFVGWLLNWVLLPTKVYRDSWRPSLSSTNFNSAYFEGQGTNLLLFSFPVMFMAGLGCVYLHFHTNKLEKKEKAFSSSSSKRTGKGKFFSFLRRPRVISPLGIVTGVELAFLTMFVALLVWSLANYLHRSFGHSHKLKHGIKPWQVKFRIVALMLGYVGNICWAFLFFPVARGSSLLPLIGLNSESSIKYHIWLGHISNTLFTLHGIGYIVYWAMTNKLSEMLEWSRTWVSNVAGEIALVMALAMWATSFAPIRRRMFEVFYYAHHLYVLFIFFYVLHVGVDFMCTVLPGIFLFLIDRYLRFLQSQRKARLVSARLLPCGSVELNFSKCQGLQYSPTSIMFINVPTISKLQWHPFTVISNSNLEPDELSLVVKCLGSWSQKLSQQISTSADHRLEVSVEGPYGPVSSHFLRHEALVLISGGSGITPFISIIREIIFQSSSNPNSQIPSQILLICAFKNSADLAMLDLLLPAGGTPHPIPDLRIEAFVTRDKEMKPEDESSSQIQTLWFRQNGTDSPVAAALGSNSWIWLGAIISGSFVIYLVLIGLATQYYIYPIDGNTNMRFSTPAKAALNILSICVAVVVTATVGFLWNNRRSSSQTTPVLNRAIPAPTTTSPATLLSGGDSESAEEVESQPRILLEVEGESVGVLASGPKKMRQRVANYCQSSIADNLHFHSISFAW
ncbi:unnamed protein product [Linum tenue]|uniref:FAD-binding FR-type domain-containing protein n=1 Tax=Linum tenue TaxID=586396 RepID=A0AAV0QQC7_9ROSI|nr:unnamed protein product [Linum tenue]